MFNELYRLGESVEVENCEGVYGCAAKAEGQGAVMLTRYSDDDAAEAKTVRVEMSGLSGENGVKAKFYLLDQDNDMALVKEEIFAGETFSTYLTIKNLSTVLIRLETV